MLFDHLSELGSSLSDGFLMDEIVSLLQKNDYSINIDDSKLLHYIENYFELVKQGYNFFVNQEYPKDNADETLNAFKNIVYVLVNYFNKPNLNITDFPTELQKFENEIKSIIKEKEIKQNKVENSLKLFKLIGKRLLGESEKLAETDEDFFEF